MKRTRISVIVPTITGREEMFADVIAAYRTRTKGYTLQFVNPKDYPNWPAACNVGMKTATGDVFAFGSDDLFPIAGWADAMMGAFAADELPAAQVWNWTYDPDQPPANLDADGPPGTITTFSRVVALRRDMAEAIGPWPEIDYYADNWVSDAARVHGWQTRVTAGYAFVHMWHPHGRLDGGDWVNRSLHAYNAERAKLGLGPA
jgi:hypothetical protein